jgi:pimeloyl-ACP methyl ester carboxylesterase
MVRTLDETDRRGYWHDWDRVACPTLLVLAESSFISSQESQEMLRRRPATIAVSVPGTGHDLHLERPDALLDLLTTFLGSSR